MRYFSIYRPFNILFIISAQWLCAYFLNFSASFASVSEGGIYWLMLGTASAAAFGYWINDFFDKERDFINKPQKTFIHRLNPYLVLTHLLFFILLTLYAGYSLDTWFLYLFITTLIALFLYSFKLKDLLVLGNLIIASLSFITIYAVHRLFDGVDVILLLHFALMAGLLILTREIIKDAEDMEGDKLESSKTLPIAIGLNYTNLIVYVGLLFAISFLVISLFYQRQYLQSNIQIVYYIYCALFMVIPLYKIAIDVRFAKTVTDYSTLSKMVKYVLFTGILSILFF